MSEQKVEKLGFGYIDDTDESLQSRSNISFGLNQGFLTKFEYNPNGGKNGSQLDALDIEFTIDNRKFSCRKFPITKAYSAKGTLIEESNTQEYKDAYNYAWTHLAACVTHILKCFVVESDIRRALEGVTSFKDWAKALSSLIKESDFNKELDIFLEYRKSNKDDGKKFLQVPDSLRDGFFLCPSRLRTFKEIIQEDGVLIYKNDAGEEHPFTRSKYYMNSEKAKRESDTEGRHEYLGNKSNESEKSNTDNLW